MNEDEFPVTGNHYDLIPHDPVHVDGPRQPPEHVREPVDMPDDEQAIREEMEAIRHTARDPGYDPAYNKLKRKLAAILLHKTRNNPDEVRAAANRELDAADVLIRDLIGSRNELINACKNVFESLDDLDGEDAPGHCHRVPGVWDIENKDELAGKPCDRCAKWNKLRSLIY
jgi:hypothetical protein